MKTLGVGILCPIQDPNMALPAFRPVMSLLKLTCMVKLHKNCYVCYTVEMWCNNLWKYYEFVWYSKHVPLINFITSTVCKWGLSHTISSTVPSNSCSFLIKTTHKIHYAYRHASCIVIIVNRLWTGQPRNCVSIYSQSTTHFCFQKTSKLSLQSIRPSIHWPCGPFSKSKEGGT